MSERFVTRAAIQPRTRLRRLRATLTAGVVLLATVLAGTVAGTGVTAIAPPAPAAAASAVNGPISGGEMLERARSWIDEGVWYSQEAWHTNRFGSYRQDCSGYVSMAWHLDHSRTTWTLWDVSFTVAARDLLPGDILLRDSGGVDHVALFVRWADAAKTRPVVWEEYDYGRRAEERVWDSLRGFTPRRYVNRDDRQPYGTIGRKYDSLGGPNGLLGRPVLPELAANRGGRFHQFERGMIIWRPDVAHAVHGRILDEYRARGSEEVWGFPTMDELASARSPKGTVGRYQYFQEALILWSAVTDAHLIHGKILTAFERDGREAVLGYPTMDELDAAASPVGTKGRYQYFESAVVLWSAATGAHPVRGEILPAFESGGREAELGYPTMDEMAAARSPAGTTGRYQYFEEALALWSPTTGARLLSGEILEAFEANGREAALGYPTGPQVTEGEGIAQPFEEATIHWTAERGAWMTPT